MNFAVSLSAFFRKADAFLKFALLADVEALNRTVVAHHAGPDLALLALGILEFDLFVLQSIGMKLSAFSCSREDCSPGSSASSLVGARHDNRRVRGCKLKISYQRYTEYFF